MWDLTLEQHRARLANLAEAERDVAACYRTYRTRDYLAGQAVYNLGDYPAPFSIKPTEYDYNLLKKLSGFGIGLIQLHEEWNDAIRRFGADKYSSHDEAGLREFIDLCHSFGIKVIPYLSSSYIHSKDPDFREEFTRTNATCTAIHHDYRITWAGSPQWRAFILAKTRRVLDDYDFDGLFNDMGYDAGSILRKEYEARGEVFDPDEYPYDPEVEDLLCTIYAEVKRRGGVYKWHTHNHFGPPCREQVYDYLWVGEGFHDERQFKRTRGLRPYVVPGIHRYWLETEVDPDYFYTQAIPFMQFPLLCHGRPITGRSVEVPGVTYYGADDPASEYTMKKKIGEYYRAHPDGPYTYTEWGSIPDDPAELDRWGHYLKLYLPMVAEGSVVRTDLRETALVDGPMPENAVVSLFTNHRQYLTMSNLSGAPLTLRLRDDWQDRENGQAGREFTVQPGKIRFLIKTE